MVGKPPGGKGVMHVRVVDVELARVDAVEPEDRQNGRERSRRPALNFLEHFVNARFVGEEAVALAPPVVEISGNDQGGVSGNRGADALGQRADLPLPAALEKSQVDVDAMQVRPALRQLDLAMKE